MSTELQEDQPQTPPNPEEMQAAWDAEAKARGTGEPVVVEDVADEPAATVAEPAQSQAAATPPAQPQQPDPMAVFMAEQRAATAELTRQLKETAGRVSTLQSELAKAGKNAAAATPGEGPTQAQIDAAVKDPAEWTQLQEDFPEWAVAMDKRLDQKIAAAVKAQQPAQAAPPAMDPATLDQTIEKQVDARLFQREATLAEQQVPGWRQTVKSPEFKSWFDKQPAEVKALANSPMSADCVKLVGSFRNSLSGQATNLTQQRQNRLALASTTRPGSGPKPAKSLEDMTPQELWKHEAALRAQRRQAA